LSKCRRILLVSYDDVDIMDRTVFSACAERNEAARQDCALHGLDRGNCLQDTLNHGTGVLALINDLSGFRSCAAEFKEKL
jgi:hypothetical protein